MTRGGGGDTKTGIGRRETDNKRGYKGQVQEGSIGVPLADTPRVDEANDLEVGEGVERGEVVKLGAAREVDGLQVGEDHQSLEGLLG